MVFPSEKSVEARCDAGEQSLHHYLRELILQVFKAWGKHNESGIVDGK